MASELTLTSEEQAELREFQITSLPEIQREITSSSSLRPLVEYTNQLLRIVLFPLNFFKYEREIKDEDQSKYAELKGILTHVHTTYFQSNFEPIDLVLFMCGFEPVCDEQDPGIRPEDDTQIRPMLKNTTQEHRDNFGDLQVMGREFLGKLLEFSTFNRYLNSIENFSSNQPYRVAMSISSGEYNNAKFKSIIDKLFITDDERGNQEFNNQNNSMYMTKLKTGRVMKLFGLSDETVTSILSTLSGGGRRTSRRKQTKSRNPRKHKSTKRRRRKSMKYRKL
jgi:hypothetical protein